jgi:uncharacterized protein (TIGR02391 family)
VPRDFSLTEAEIVGLPIDELGLEILRDVDADVEAWASRNWVMAAREGYGRNSPAIPALQEAWGWLYTSGLVARDFDQTESSAFLVTRLGRRVLSEGIEVARVHDRLAMELHPKVEAKVRRQFFMGEYELACFAAMKLVEVRVRELAGMSDSTLGVKLMIDAFSPSAPGPLCDPSMDGGEAVARMNLFAGAIGLFKNPTSHRDVRFDDPVEAAEVILFADLLMRILDRVEAEVVAARNVE